MSWRDRVDLIVQAGMRGRSVGDFVWDGSSWDTGATWSGLEPAWVTLDNWTLEGFSSRRGRQAATRRHSAGTAEIRLVWRDPADGWSLRPASPVQLGQEMRVLARGRSRSGEPITAALPIYRGAVRQIRDGWAPAKSGQMVFRLTARLTDRFADLAAVDPVELGAPEGAGDTSDQRIARILSLAGIDAFYLRAEASSVTHQASAFGRNLLDEAQLTAEGESGDLFVDRDGFVYLHQRLGTGTHPREDEDRLSWTNVRHRAGIGPSAFGTSQDLDDVANFVTMAKVGGAPYTASDAESALRYGKRTFQQLELTVEDDADVEHAADWRLAQLRDRTQRIDQLTAVIGEWLTDAELAALLDLELGDRHQISWTDGQLMTGTVHVQGITHQISGREWTIALDLWAYEGEGLAPFEVGARVAAIGDSILQIGGGGSMQPWRQGSTFFALACWRSSSRMRYWGAWGNSGDTTAAMLARIGTITALSPKPDACVIEGGTNDTNGDVAASQANITAMCDALDAAGILPILTTIVPAATPADAANNMALNAWMRAFAIERAYPLADFWAALADDAGAWASAGDTSDGTHPTLAGATKMADVLAAAIVPATRDVPEILTRAIPRDPLGVWIDSLDAVVSNASAPNGGSVTVTLDTGDKAEGSGSSKFVITSVPTLHQARAWHSPALLDLSGFDSSMPLKLRVKVSTLTNLGDLRVRLGHVTNGWDAEWKFPLPSAANVWEEVQSTTGIGSPTATIGTPDLSAVNKVQLEAWALGGAYSGTIRFDDLRLGAPDPIPATADLLLRRGIFDVAGAQGQDADWSRYGGTAIPTYGLISDAAIDGKWERLTATGTGQIAIYRIIPTGAGWAVGDRILFTGRVKFSGAAASTLVMQVIFTGAAAGEYCMPFYGAAEKFSDPVLFAMERVIPSGTTALRVDLMCNAVAGDVVEWAQIGVIKL